ncbi:MAG: hypothetical protein WCI29_06935 [Actinomycetes bacterium]
MSLTLRTEVELDAALAALETTSHNPGVRRFAVTVVDVGTTEIVAKLSDGPFGPVRRRSYAGWFSGNGT